MSKIFWKQALLEIIQTTQQEIDIKVSLEYFSDYHTILSALLLKSSKLLKLNLGLATTVFKETRKIDNEINMKFLITDNIHDVEYISCVKENGQHYLKFSISSEIEELIPSWELIYKKIEAAFRDSEEFDVIE